MTFRLPVEHVGPGTPVGEVLRRHWQPVAVAGELRAGTAQAVRILGEDLTLYRGAGGEAHVVAARCPHRGTFLHTGWVEDDCLRCSYHGWAFDPSGQCVDQPAEPPDRAASVRIGRWPVEEYADLVWVYLGAGEPPPLPHYPELDDPGVVALGSVRPPGPWPINFFQAIENHVDPVHTAFVHRATEPYAREVPEVSVEPTDGGLAVTAVRSGVPRRTWYRFPCLIQIPMRHIVDDQTELHFFNWAVPVDDRQTMFLAATAVPVDLVDRVRSDQAGRSMDPDAGPDLLAGRRRPASVTEEDYVALCGQGPVADRDHERLGRSDVGVIALRHLWQEAAGGGSGLGDGPVDDE